MHIYAVLSYVQKGNQEENCDFFFFSIALSLYLAGIKWDKCNKEPGFQHGAQPVKEKPESTGKPTETPT